MSDSYVEQLTRQSETALWLDDVNRTKSAMRDAYEKMKLAERAYYRAKMEYDLACQRILGDR